MTDEYSLKVVNATTNDSGTYQCVAQNQYSTAQDQVDVTVAGILTAFMIYYSNRNNIRWKLIQYLSFLGIYVHPQCLDSPAFARCPLILRAGYCTHKYYSKFCCRSCTLAGQLPPNALHARTVWINDNIGFN